MSRNSLKFSDVLAYPYQSDNLLTMVVIPGVVYIVDLILMFAVMLIIVLIAVAIMIGMGIGMSSWVSAVPTLFHQSATLIAKLQVGFLPASVVQVISAKLHLFASHLDGVFSHGWHSFNLGEDWGRLFSVDADPGGDVDLGDKSDHGSSGGSSGSSGGLNASGNGPLYSAYWFGLEWALYRNWKTGGMDAPPPSPFEGRYFINGLKGFLFYGPVNLMMVAFHLLIIVGLLMLLCASLGMPFVLASFPEAFGELKNQTMLGSVVGLETFVVLLIVYILFCVLSGFFLAPFWIAPMMVSCEEQTVASLYDFPKAIQITVEHYPRVLLSFLLIGVLGLLYGVVSLALCCTCVGLLLFPFIWSGAFRVSAALLLADAFGLLDRPDVVDEPPVFATI